MGSLPSYFLSLFAAPKCVINKIEKIRREFLWGKNSSGHKIRWIRWDLILKSRKGGGLGVGSIQDFNTAMLSKWWWRFKSNPLQLWASTVAAIHKGRDSISAPQFIPLRKAITGVWKDVVSVDGTMSKAGINIAENLVYEGDRWRWRSDPEGSFSVKVVRTDLDRARDPAANSDQSCVWNSWAPPKVKVLLWRACLGKVATKTGLIHRGVPLADGLCPRCGLEKEDSDHLFVSCLWSKCVWWNIMAWIRVSFPADIKKLNDLISFFKNQPGGKIWKKVIHSIVLGTVWRIWLVRNEKVFNNRFIPILKTVESIQEDVFCWLNIRSKLKVPSWENWSSFDILEM
ncbi:uncharacterized protein LOC110866053 [Helianthus annuus]|uniref:uncharacterized protein LOC110866053 n=1 Tax=Helianthus annuus TaxID=4232 RepID=UPI000B8F1122|nr:uncharacterized protein LOC110866053 [Helianthus annuus]